MKRLLLPPIFSAALLASPCTSGAQGIPVATNEAAAWIRHTVPLPREIAIPNKVALARAEVAIESRLPASPAGDRAVQELREALRVTSVAPARSKARFTVTLQLGGDGAEPLRGLPNADQAYRILPAPDGRGLRLVALEPRGIYYAAKTLQQLIRARAGPARLEIPLASVRDWPEMEDRGLWGTDAYECLEWLAERKLNYVEQIAAPRVDPKTQRGAARPKPGHEPLLDLGPKLGIEYVPVILHLEQLDSKGVFEAFPNLRAQGAGKPGAVCYSQPQFVGVLADWLADLARLPHVTEVDVWLAENLQGKGGCKCAECKKTDRSVLELRTVLAAWREAQKRVGKFGLRVLTSEETYPSHKLLFPEIPGDVKLWYYHSLFTYTAMERAMITGETAKFAASGHWVGVCPSLVAHVGFTEPFTSGQFVQARVREFTDKKLRGIIGYPSPRVRYARYNVEAMAEWTWNPQGRTPREFAVAWATREHIRAPEKFAEWAELHGAVAWDVYGSDWPAGEQRHVPGPVAELLCKGELPPLGEVKWGVYPAPWGDIQSAAQLDADVQAAARAVALAREIGVEEFLQESLVVQGYINALKALWELKQIVTPQGVASENRGAAAAKFEAYHAAVRQSLKALPAWESTVAAPNSREGYVRKPGEKLREMLTQMQTTASQVLRD